jgi:hypothetical protein
MGPGSVRYLWCQALQCRAMLLGSGILVSREILPEVRHISSFESLTDDEGPTEDVEGENRASDSGACIE